MHRDGTGLVDLVSVARANPSTENSRNINMHRHCMGEFTDRDDKDANIFNAACGGKESSAFVAHIVASAGDT